MKANIENIQKYAGQGFIKGLVVAALCNGERLDISPTSAFLRRLGFLSWGAKTGLVNNGKPVDLPPELFDEIPDRRIDGQSGYQAFLNVVRSKMTPINKKVNLAVVIGICLMSLGIGAVWGVVYAKTHGSQIFGGQAQSQQQYRGY